MRELLNVVNRLGLNVQQKEISVEDVRRVLSGNVEMRGMEENSYVQQGTARGERLLELQEKECILEALRANGCNITDSARYLNISRATLYNKIRKHNIVLNKRASGWEGWNAGA